MTARTGAAFAALAAALAVALAVLLAREPTPTPAPPAGPPHASTTPRAHVWMTTPDGRERLADRGTVPFTEGASDRLTITVDPSLQYQQMDGFGASITDSSASLLMDLDPATRDATMRDLFATDGLSFLRQPIGSSDFDDGPHHTFDDVAPGRTDFDLSEFSIDHDRDEILPLLRRALEIDPDLEVMATPWSPPAWMKDGGSLVGGRLRDDPRIYQAYADYLVAFVRAYEAEGVPVHALTVQNEPQNRRPGGYPGTDLPVRQAAAVIERLGPALREAGLDTRILGYDHNWSLHPDDAASTPPGEDPEVDYPAELLASSAGRWLAGTAFHCYAGDPARMTDLHRRFPDKDLWLTECSGSRGPSDPPDQVFNDTLTGHARTLVLGATRGWAKSVVTWNLALRPDGGPHNGGCDTCTGVVTVGDDGTVIRNAEYYALGHLGRFVRPGARRVASTSYGSTGWNGMPMSSAFVNPDGSTAVVVHNEHEDPRTVAVAAGGQSFDYTLPGGALATFTWPASEVLSDGDDLVDPGSTTVTASAGDAGVAADDDGATAWRAPTQRAGEWLQVDLGSPQRVRSVTLDAGPLTFGSESSGAASTEAPGSYLFQVSADGRHWTDVRRGHGTGQLTVLTTPDSPARYLRTTLTADAPGGWQVADVRVHR